MIALVLDIPDSIGKIDDQQYLDLCKQNPDARIERSLDNTLFGENVLPEFELDLKEIE